VGKEIKKFSSLILIALTLNISIFFYSSFHMSPILRYDIVYYLNNKISITRPLFSNKKLYRDLYVYMHVYVYIEAHTFVSNNKQ